MRIKTLPLALFIIGVCIFFGEPSPARGAQDACTDAVYNDQVGNDVEAVGNLFAKITGPAPDLGVMADTILAINTYRQHYEDLTVSSSCNSLNLLTVKAFANASDMVTDYLLEFEFPDNPAYKTAFDSQKKRTVTVFTAISFIV